MASITSLMNSSYNTSSIYGNRNVLTGLASGMDTESMIENAVSGIKTKIQNLYKKRTKIEWQQEAYRSIIDKAVNFNTKYTSYSSKTNLLSSSFFSNAVNTVTAGTYADKITASGRTTSEIKINAVKQMAKAASYTVSGTGTPFSDASGAVTGDAFDILKELDVNNISGSLTFQYGGTNGTNFDISFDDLEDWSQYEGKNSAEKIANAINQKLSEVTYNYTKNGFQETTTADKAIKAVAKDGRITFQENELKNGNSITISSASGKIKDAFDLDGNDNKTLKVGNFNLTTPTKAYSYLSDKSLGITFNGTTKNISLDEIVKSKEFQETDDADKNDKFVELLQNKLDNAFGKSKIQADYTDGKLSFQSSGEGDTLSLGGSAIEAIGFESGDSNFINPGKKLSDLLGDKADSIFSQANRLKGEGSITKKTSPNGTTYYLDSKGSYVDKDGNRVDADGKAIYDFEINGAHINVTEDTTLESLINSVNSNANAGVKVSYSKLTNEFKFTTTETGSNSKIEFGGLAKDIFGSSQAQNLSEQKFADAFGMNLGAGGSGKITLSIPGNMDTTISISADDTVQDVLDKLNDPSSFFAHNGNAVSINALTGEFTVTDQNGKICDFTVTASDGTKLQPPSNPYASFTAGQDAVLDVEINGKQFENLTRSSNSFDLDGLTINVKGEFNTDGTAEGKDGAAYEPVTFNTTTDSDKIVDAIRDFVNDYNEMITEIKSAYSTLPAQQTNGSRYEPLTAEQEDGMTESEIKSYEEKAKQGILFGDSNLSSMYSKLLNAIQPGGTDGQTLREIGISTSYNNGLTTLSLDEDKLRSALESNPDKVKDAFTKTKDGGSSSNGIMKTMQSTLDTYVKTTGEPKGVLIQRAGSTKAYTSLNNNSLKSQMDSIDNQIERWQNKMSDQIDRYTTQFSRLEQLIAEMNSQASAMSGLMGGTSGY